MRFAILAILAMASTSLPASAQAPLSKQIDDAIRSGHSGPFAKPASDEEFLRRITLDLTGTIPTAAEVRAFLADTSPDKRARRIDALLASPDFPRRMAEAFTVMFEERRETKEIPVALWEKFLVESFARNRPWNELVRLILTADPDDAERRAASRFYLDREGDGHQITRDVGRLFLGRDIECSRCHDHPTVTDYTQRGYFGLYAFLNRSFPFKKKSGETVFAEKFAAGSVDFESVFTMEKMTTLARLPDGKEIAEPTFAKGDEYREKPDPKKGVAGTPKFSPRAVLAEKLTEPAARSLFVRNAANRLWFLMMGRGVVHPLDLHHSENPPMQPKLLDVLADGLIERKFDVRQFLGEIARSEAYQRSSRVPVKGADVDPGLFAVAELRPLSPEQLLFSIAQATGNFEPAFAKAKGNDALARAEAVRSTFQNPLKQFAVAFGSRAGEAETDFQPTLHGALFLSNETLIQNWIKTYVERLLKNDPSPQILAEQLYLDVLSRSPTADERTEVAKHLERRRDRSLAVGELAWALVASTEFRLNH